MTQLQCVVQKIDAFLEVLEASPYADNMIVLIHGDHGSRLDCGPPKMEFRQDLTPIDYIDAFSTLLAIKHPDLGSGYDRRILPIDRLFEASVREASTPAGQAWTGSLEVLLLADTTLVAYPMPTFERSLGCPPSP